MRPSGPPTPDLFTHHEYLNSLCKAAGGEVRLFAGEQVTYVMQRSERHGKEGSMEARDVKPKLATQRQETGGQDPPDTPTTPLRFTQGPDPPRPHGFRERGARPFQGIPSTMLTGPNPPTPHESDGEYRGSGVEGPIEGALSVSASIWMLKEAARNAAGERREWTLREVDITQLAWDSIRLPHDQAGTRQVDLQLKYSPESNSLELYSATFGGPQHDRRLRQCLEERLEVPELRRLNLTVSARWGDRIPPAAAIIGSGALTAEGDGAQVPRREDREPTRESEAPSGQPELPVVQQLPPLEECKTNTEADDPAAEQSAAVA